MKQEFLCSNDQMMAKKTVFLNSTSHNKNKFNEEQLREINEGLADNRISTNTILFYAKPLYSAKVMGQLRSGACHGLSLEKLKFLIKFKDRDIAFLSKVRVILECKEVDLNFAKSILLEDNKDIGAKYLNTQSFANGTNISTPIEMLDMAKNFITRGFFKELDDFTSSHSIKESRELLALCSKLEQSQAIQCLEMKIPLNVIYCFIYFKTDAIIWSELIEFYKSNIKAQHYAKAFCEGLFYKKHKSSIESFFEIDSNDLVDRLFIDYNFDIGSLKELSTDCVLENNHVYSGYSIDPKNESTIICKQIIKLFSTGKSIDCIKKFISSDCKFPRIALDIYMRHLCSPEQAIDAAHIIGTEVGPNFDVIASTKPMQKPYAFCDDESECSQFYS